LLVSRTVGSSPVLWFDKLANTLSTFNYLASVPGGNVPASSQETLPGAVVIRATI